MVLQVNFDAFDHVNEDNVIYYNDDDIIYAVDDSDSMLRCRISDSYCYGS